MERKEHYRMYKHGKQWMFGIVTAASVMMLGAKAEVSVHADTNQASDKTASITANNNLTQAKQVALQSTTTNTTTVKTQATNSTSTAKVTATHVAAVKAADSTVKTAESAKSTNQSTNNAASQASTSTKTSDSTTKTTNDNTQASSDGTNTSSSTNTNSTNDTTPVQVHENGQIYLRQPGSDQNITGWQSQTVNGQNEVYYYDPQTGAMVHGQQKIDGHWYYFDEKNGEMLTGFQYIPDQNKTCYYDQNGEMQYGWQYINGQTYYLDQNTGALTHGQAKINGHWYLFDQKDGHMLTGFQYLADEKLTCYYNPATGQMEYGQQKIDGHWYLFDPNYGSRLTGFQHIADQNKTCYYNQAGQMQYGWQTVNGQKYYLNSDTGAVTYGQAKINNAWYLFDHNDGHMLTGFQYIADQNKTCYYDPTTGQMQYGVKTINGHKYDFDVNTGNELHGIQYDGQGHLIDLGDNGIAVENTTVTVAGQTYTVDDQGALKLTDGQQQVAGHWYFVKDSLVQTGFQKLTDQDKTCYYDPTTAQMVYGLRQINGHWYLFDQHTGAMLTGVQFYQGWRYFNSDGTEAISEFVHQGNVWDYYNQAGVRIFGQQTINGHQYLISTQTGGLEVGFQTVAGQTHYYNENGINPNTDSYGQMLTGQQVINGKHYRFDNQGNMIVGTYVNNGQLEDYGTDGVQVINQQITDNAGHQFTFDANGNLARPANICSDGQFEFNGQWYLMNQNNQIQTGWQTIADEPGKQYYYDPVNGTMTKGQRQIDGHWYYFNEDTGAKVTNAFQKIADQNKTCYYDNNGWMVYGQQKIAGQWYLFDQHSGAMLTGFQYIPDQNKTCYYDPTTGQMQYGLQSIWGNAYYFDPNSGAEIFNQNINLGYGTAYFGGDGSMQSMLLNFTYYSQLNQGAPEGCEGTSLQIAESVRGWHHSLQQIYGTVGYGWDKDCYNGFYGNPFGGGVWKTQTVTSSWMAYMLTNLDPGIHDMTGASIQDVIHELQFGHAVVTWANYDWNANPSDQNDYHVMTIVGYRNGQFLIADPYSYSRRVYWVNQGTWNYVNKNEHANGWNLPTGMNLTV